MLFPSLLKWMPWCCILCVISDINGTLGDLPIHATINDMKGDWVFHLSNASSGDIHTCGSGIPNRNTENLDPELQDYLGFIGRTQGIMSKLLVTLSDKPIPFSAVRHLGSSNHRSSWKALAVLDTLSQNVIGGWSAVYDEGFEVHLHDGRRLMGLMKYYRGADGCMEPKDGDLEDSRGHTECYVTDPDRTHIGWYTTMKPGKQADSGCFYGQKQDVQKTTTTNSSFVYTYQRSGGQSVSLSDAAISYYTSGSFVDKHNSKLDSTWRAATDTPFLVQNRDNLPTLFMESVYKKVNISGGYTAVPSFLQDSDTAVSAVDHSGQAYACPCKEGETPIDTRTVNESSGDVVLSPLSLIESVTNIAYIREHYSGSVGSGLPREFSWPNPISHSAFSDTILNQGGCGSCYALATVQALQDRFKIGAARQLGVDLRALNGVNSTNSATSHMELLNTIQLSPQSAISCSFYNQGCHGGFPYLVGKDAAESGILGERCLPYVGDDAARCPTRQIGDSSKTSSAQVAEGLEGASEVCHSKDNRWYAVDYGYVGGCYECNQCAGEEQIMAELYHNGPVVAALDAPASLLTYQDGIYQVEGIPHARYCDSPPSDAKSTVLTGWEYTNHAVMIVGWGETTPSKEKPAQKYWIVRNTWGGEWGQHGYFLLARGVNAGGIESQATFIDPDFTRGAGLALANKIKKHKLTRNT